MSHLFYGNIIKNFAYLEGKHNFSFNFDAGFFFELIVTMVLDSNYSGFPVSVIAFNLNVIAVKLGISETVGDGANQLIYMYYIKVSIQSINTI
jgi:hypothetical protein